MSDLPSQIEAAFTHFPVLTTNRLILRQIRESDAPAFFQTFSDPVVMQYYGHEPHQSLANSEDFVRRMQRNFEQRTSLRWGVTLKDADVAIGSCSFHRFGDGYHHVETGYDLNRAYWHQGIMTEAMTAVLNYGFNTLDLHRVEAMIDPANSNSKNLLLKLGFQYEGTLRQRYYFRGQFEDDAIYGLLKHEWLKS
ncbi:MAG: GNAT family N-acetyltransferase [Anaerolineae bacterium]|nr:GNAT family N-acetyltransferase [Anaerolineae bacterium]